MRNLTNQEVFDRAAKHLLRQGRRAVGRTFECLYRAGRLKCGIGGLIPDSVYVPALDQGSGVTISLLLATQKDGGPGRNLGDETLTALRILEQSLAESGLLECDIELLLNLQSAHDQNDNDGFGWTIRLNLDLRRIAANFDLDPHVLLDHQA